MSVKTSYMFNICLSYNYCGSDNFVTDYKLFSTTNLNENTRLFISPSGISELDCATTKADTAERSTSIGRESLQVFFLY